MPACCTTTAGRVTTWRRSRKAVRRGRRRARHRHRKRRARDRRRPGGSAARLRQSRPAISRRSPSVCSPPNGVRDRVTLVRRLVARDRAARAGRPARVRGHRQRAVRGGDPRDDARRAPPAAEARRAADSARAQLFARPLLLPETEARQRAIGRSAVQRWRGLYGIDFEPLLDAAAPARRTRRPRPRWLARWPPVGPPTILAVLDLTVFDAATVRRRPPTSSVDERRGVVNADRQSRSAPTYTGRSRTHSIRGRGRRRAGRPRYGCCLTRLDVGPDAALRVRYSRRVRGTPDGLRCEVVERDAG